MEQTRFFYKIKKHCFWSVLVLSISNVFFTQEIYAQLLETSGISKIEGKKKKISKGENFFNKGNYNQTIKYFSKKISKKSSIKDEKYAYYNYYIGESYRKTNRLIESIPYFKICIDEQATNGKSCPENAYLHYVFALKAMEKYGEGVEVLEKYLDFAKDGKIIGRAKVELKNLKYLDVLRKKKYYYKIKNMTQINTASDEFGPFYHRGKIYFTTNAYRGKEYKADGTYFSNVYSVKAKGAKVNMKTLKKMDGVNSANVNDASISMTSRGTYQVFAKGNSGKKRGTDDVHIYARIKRRGKWKEPFMLSLNKANSWDSCPYITPNGKTIYFASNRLGGYGGTDLYVASIARYGKWKNIRNLGPEINSSGNEMFPYIAENGILYFSSDGHPSFGGLDLFSATLKEGKYVIENMGLPLNSPKDDFGYFMFDKERGFFSSNRDGGKGRDDIYTFVIQKPDFKTVDYFLEVTTQAKKENGEMGTLPLTRIICYNKVGEEIYSGDTDEKGLIKFPVLENNEYSILAQKNHYISKRKVWTMFGKALDKTKLKQKHTTKMYKESLTLEVINVKRTFTLENILYDFDKADIQPVAEIELNRLIQILKDNPHIVIQLNSHTDSKGDDDYNHDLSQRRAESAVNYIINTGGIDKKRIFAKGYGETKPIAANETPEGEDNPEGRRQNRRTEFNVVSYKELYDADEFFEGEETISVDDDDETIDDDTTGKQKKKLSKEEAIEIELDDLLKD